MTRERYLAALDRLGLGKASVVTAQALGVQLGAIQRWASGARAVPGTVECLLDMYLAHGLPQRFIDGNAPHASLRRTVRRVPVKMQTKRKSAAAPVRV